MSGMVFDFYTDDGHFRMSYSEYMDSPELREKMLSPFRARVNLGLKQLSFDWAWLDAHKGEKQFFQDAQAEFDKCPVRYYLPNCARYDSFAESPMHQFINDNTNDYVAAIAGNRLGKSTAMWIKELVCDGFIECDPKWEIFTDHGINFTTFTGAKNIMAVTYEWSGHRQTFWPNVIRAWTPKSELGKKVHWNVPQRTAGEAIKMEISGSTINLHTLEQVQPFESTAYDNILWDEQGVDEKVEATEFRLKTRRRYDGKRIIVGRHICAATPHKVKGRPDTGAGTWFHKLYTKEETRGWNSKFYAFNLVKGPPDWIYPEREKERLLKDIEEAERVNNMKRVRSLRSRAFGEFEWSGGLVYDEWNPEIHVIEDFDIPWNWCAGRAGDHGRVNDAAFVWGAISPENDVYFFRDMELAGRQIDQLVDNIIRLSGNKREVAGTVQRGRLMGERYKEVFESEAYLFTVLDPRSFSKSDEDSECSVGDLYRQDGLQTIKPAVGKELNFGIDICSRLMRPDYEKEHPYTGVKGRPRLFVMRSCKAIIKGLSMYRNAERKDKNKNPSEKPQDKDDHMPDAIRYFVSMKPSYDPNRTIGKAPEVEKENTHARGYTVPEDKPKSVGKRTCPYTRA